MSIRSGVRKQAGTSGNRSLYVRAFLRDVHRLIARGYDETFPSQQQKTLEEDITKRIVQEITRLIEAKDAPRWMKRYVATDNLPLSLPKKPAKQRPRIDIEILCTRGSPRPRFHFEAKRLGEGNPVGKYLGEEGLGCFLAGQYARDSDEAGMLGYVQNDTCASWATKIRQAIARASAKHAVVAGTDWEEVKISPECQDSYRTQHNRWTLGKPVTVYHTLLLFH
jgi:hypothetical protein